MGELVRSKNSGGRDHDKMVERVRPRFIEKGDWLFSWPDQLRIDRSAQGVSTPSPKLRNRVSNSTGGVSGRKREVPKIRIPHLSTKKMRKETIRGFEIRITSIKLLHC